ncbi:3D domain-containing protein [Desulfatirhabdium butyrativorans]|uniref:3D domain-containing protein n=1 Tax=Desulfatirhabdium butyrativorans TaxID=340467 RepID=UPI0004131038|nr:3D domain-containing protein [Desulfatirhabdium butyrativorans]
MILSTLQIHDSIRRCAIAGVYLLTINAMLLAGILWQARTTTDVLERQTELMQAEAEQAAMAPDPEESSGHRLPQPERIMAIKAVVTAYTARRQETDSDPERTAIMEKPIPGWTCAVSRDLSHWLGGKVWIEGVGVRRVNDVMNERYKKRVDVLVGKPKEAVQIASEQRQVVFLGKDQG